MGSYRPIENGRCSLTGSECNAKELERPKRENISRPVHSLSVRLIDTYKSINRKHTRLIGNYNQGHDDEDYNYIMGEEETIGVNYIVQRKSLVGNGTFGKVYKAKNSINGESVAVKIIKSKRQFMVQAQREIEILLHLQRNDPNGEFHCCYLTDTFIHRNHQCLVFEMLSSNLFELLKLNHFKGFRLGNIQKFAHDILVALNFLAQPQVDVIHCDLKPENVLLCSHDNRSCDVTIIDFGSACRATRRMYSYIQSRFYRSPEAMLGLPYMHAIDMWSLGCILVELHTGKPLFPGVDQFDQMCFMVSTLGIPRDDLIGQSPPQYRGQFFEPSDGETWFIQQPQNADNEEVVDNVKNVSAVFAPKEGSYKLIHHLLQKRLRGSSGIKYLRHRSIKELISNHRRRSPRISNSASNDKALECFIDLVSKMLSFSAKERITPIEALRHPFFIWYHPRSVMLQGKKQVVAVLSRPISNYIFSLLSLYYPPTTELY